MSVEFFAPVKTITEVDSACWELQTSTLAESVQRAADSQENGDECASGTYGARLIVSESYVCKLASGNLALPSVGASGLQNASGWHIDGYSVSYRQNGAATLQITAHKHGANAHDRTRTASPSVTLPARVLGVPSGVVGLSDSGVGIRSLYYGVTIQHFDELDEDGVQCASGSCDAVETISCELTSAASVSVNGFEQTEKANSKPNNGAASTSFVLTKHIVKPLTDVN